MPFATVYQTFEVVFRAVPRQSLRARSKCDTVPGPPGAPWSTATVTVSTCETESYLKVTFALSDGTVNAMFEPFRTPPAP